MKCRFACPPGSATGVTVFLYQQPFGPTSIAGTRIGGVDDPRDPIAAVTHPDPYPYYATLVARPGIERDATLGMWIAARAAHVTAALTSDLLRVRPASEPVPAALVGSMAGDVFSRLVRMNDGAGHAPMKTAAAATLDALDATRVAEEAGRCGQVLSEELAPHTAPGRVVDFAFRLPVYVVARLLGIPGDALASTATWTGDFVRCLAPGATPEHLARGAEAAGRLRDLFRGRLAASGDGLLPRLASAAKAAGRDDDAIAANGIGFLSQAYEATAGLIGNTLVALGRHAQLRDQLQADPGHLRAVVREVVRFDSPVQNTRRFVARDGVVAGRPMQAGDAVLVVLAAANRDPDVNPHPERFDMFRAERHAFTFGVGAHACPGEELATTIAQIGVERLLAAGVDPAALADTVTYRPSVNIRIPVFAAPS